MLSFYGNEYTKLEASLAVSPRKKGLIVIDLRQAFFPLFCGQPSRESKANLNSTAAMAALCCSLEIQEQASPSPSLCYSSMHFIVLEKQAHIRPSDNLVFMVQRISDIRDNFHLLKVMKIYCGLCISHLKFMTRSECVTTSACYCIFSALPEGTPIKYILTIIMAASAQGRSLPPSHSGSHHIVYFLIVPFPPLSSSRGPIFIAMGFGILRHVCLAKISKRTLPH